MANNRRKKTGKESEQQQNSQNQAQVKPTRSWKDWDSALAAGKNSREVPKTWRQIDQAFSKQENGFQTWKANAQKTILDSQDDSIYRDKDQNTARMQNALKLMEEAPKWYSQVNDEEKKRIDDLYQNLGGARERIAWQEEQMADFRKNTQGPGEMNTANLYSGDSPLYQTAQQKWESDQKKIVENMAAAQQRVANLAESAATTQKWMDAYDSLTEEQQVAVDYYNGGLYTMNQAKGDQNLQAVLSQYGKDGVKMMGEAQNRRKNENRTQAADDWTMQFVENHGALADVLGAALTPANATLSAVSAPYSVLKNLAGNGEYATADPNSMANILNVVKGRINSERDLQVQGKPTEKNLRDIEEARKNGTLSTKTAEEIQRTVRKNPLEAYLSMPEEDKKVLEQWWEDMWYEDAAPGQEKDPRQILEEKYGADTLEKLYLASHNYDPGLMEGGLFQKGTSFLHSAASSAADSAAGALTGGAAYTIGMGASAYQQSASDYAKQGIRSGLRSEAAALANGAIEAWTEGRTVERLENAMFGTGQDIRTAAAGEGFEEGLGDILKLGAEGLILGRDSGYSRNIQQKMMDGMPWNQARQEALKDFALETLYDTALGAASGAMGQIGGRAMQRVNELGSESVSHYFDQARGMYTGGHDGSYMTTSLSEGDTVQNVMETGDIVANEYVRRATSNRGLLTRDEIADIVEDVDTRNAILQKAGMDPAGFESLSEGAKMDTIRGAVNRISNWVYQLQGKATQSHYENSKAENASAIASMQDSGNETVNAAISKAVAGERVSNKEVEGILNDPVALSALRRVADVKGVEKMTTLSGKRAAVRQALNGLAKRVQQEQTSREQTTEQAHQVEQYVSERTMTPDTYDTVMNGPASADLSGRVIYTDENGNTHDSAAKRFVNGPDGKLMLEMEDGSQVEARGVSYGTAADQVVYQKAAKIAPNARVANLLVDSYQTMAKASNMTEQRAVAFAEAMEGAFQYGREGLSFRAFMNSAEARGFTNQQLSWAYNAGSITARGDTQAKQNDVNRKLETVRGRQGRENDGKVFVDGKEVKAADIDGSSLTEKQKATVHAARVLAKATGVQYHFAKSETVDGQRGFYIGERKAKNFYPVNGAFVWYDNSIWIDLDAGNGNESLSMFTMAHETTHFINEWSPAEFRKLQRFLFDRMYARQGIDAKALIDTKVKELTDPEGHKPSRELATEEVVAEAMQEMFTATDALEHIAALRSENENLWQKLRDHIHDVAQKLKTAAKGLTPEGPEAQVVRTLQEDMGTIENLFSQGVAEAAKVAGGEVTTENGQKNNATSDGGVRFQPRVDPGISDQERYRLLKDATVSIPEYNGQSENAVTAKELDSLTDIDRKTARNILRALGDRYQAFRTFKDGDVELEFAFSHGGLEESINKMQTRDYRQYAKFLSIIDDVIRGSAEIEEHGDRYGNNQSNIKATHVLVGGFREGERFTPVKMEVREFTDATESRLRVAVTLGTTLETKQEAAIIARIESPSGETHVPYAASTITLQQFAALVKVEDGTLLKYFPDQMLDAARKKSKADALTETQKYIDKKNKDKGWDGTVKKQARKIVSDMGAKEYNRTVVLEESTIDKYLQDYAAKSSPNYAQAYIAKMSPRDFLNLTTSTIGRINIQQEAKPLDAEKMGEASRYQPIQLHIDTETGEVVGHEGRHRMEALRRAGIGSVPVLLFDSSNKNSKQPMDLLTLTGQDFGSSRSDASVDARFLLPLSYANRDEVLRRFGTVPSLEAMQTKYSGKETVKFQGHKAVEETKDLLAIHNLTERNLADSLNLGGLPSPSIAIVKAIAGHTMYGPISFLFAKNTIDPESDIRNKVYGSDAYTPTAPSIEYEVNDKAESRLRDKYYDLYRKYGNELSRPLYGFGNYAEDELNKYHGVDGAIDHFSDNTDMMRLYLADTKGETVADVQKEEVTRIPESYRTMYDFLIENTGKDIWVENMPSGAPMPFSKWIIAHESDFKNAYAEYCRSEGMTADEINAFYEDDAEFMNTARSVWRGIRDYVKNGPEKRRVELDVGATKKAIRDAVDQGAYMEWLHGLFDGMEKRKGIYNGKDRYTSSGNSRSFSALHYEYTLDNIVRAMVEGQAERGGQTWGLTAGTLQATATPEYSSIAEIKKDSKRLGRVSEEELSAAKEALSAKIEGVIGDIFNSTKHWDDNRFSEMEHIGDAVKDAALGRRTTTAIMNSMKKSGWPINAEIAERIIDLYKDAAAMPTEYFEAKPQRAIGFEEVLAAVLPDNASPSLISRLAQQGVPVVTYEAGNEEDRLAKLNSIDGAMFQERKKSDAKTIEALEKRNAVISDELDRTKKLLDLQKKATGGKLVTRSSVEALARNLRKQFDCGGETRDLADRLQACYEQIAGDEELSMARIREYAAPVTEWLQQNARDRLDPFAEETLRRMKGTKITLTETQKQEAISQYGSMQDFRRALAGSGIQVVNQGGTSLDVMWADLQEVSPMLFTDNITEGDMVTALADGVATLRDMRTDVSFGMGQAFWDQDAFEAVYDGYWNASTLHTVADKYQKQILELKGKHKTDMDRLRETKNEAIADLRKAERAKRDNLRAEAAQRLKEKTTALKEGYKESRAKAVEGRNKTAMRYSIQKIVKRINDILLTDSATKHVPDNLKKAVAESLYIVNMDTTDTDARLEKLRHDMVEASNKGNVKQVQEISKRISNLEAIGDRMDEKLTALKNAYDSILDDPDLESYDPEGISNLIQTCIDLVGDTPLRNMNMEQLQAVKDLYTAVRHTISEANHTFIEGKKVATAEAATAVMREVTAQNRRYGAHTKTGDMGLQLSWANLKPVYAIKRIGSQTMMKLYQGVRKGQDTWYRDVEAANAFLREQAKKYGYKNWDMERTYTFTSETAGDFQLTLPQIMSLYAFSKREQARDHIRKGGIVLRGDAEKVIKRIGKLEIKGTEMDSSAYNITDETLGDIIGTLSEDQKAYVDTMQKYLSEVMGEKGNEVSRELYGIRLFKEENYFPLRSAPEYMARARESQQKEEILPKLKNKGFTKSTAKHASNPIILDNFLDVWSDHVNEMSMYHAFTVPLESFGKVYNFKTQNEEETKIQSVTATLKNAYGAGATTYIETLLNQLNGGARSDPNVGLINKTTALFKKGATFMSLSVVIQQPSAIMRATAMIDPKYFIGPKVTAGKHSEIWNELKAHAAVAGIKEMGYFDVGLGRSTRDYIQNTEYETWQEKVDAIVHDSNYRDEVLGRAPALADEVAWCGIWNAVKREQKAAHPDMDVTSQQFLDLCGDRFSEVIDYTQVYDSVLTRSQLMRSKDTGLKMATSFMAEPTVNANMLASAIDDFRRGNKTMAARQIGGVVTAAILNSILVSFVYAARDDDEEEEYWEKYLAQFTGNLKESLNPLNMLPFGRDIMSLWSGYKVERSDMAIVKDFIQSWQTLFNEKASPLTKVEKFSGAVGNMLGMPIRNIIRDAHGIYNVVQDAFDGNHSTAAGAWNAVKGEIPGMKSEKKDVLMYQSLLKGDQETYKRMRQLYKDDATADTALRKVLRDRDPRIREAAQARLDGKQSQYETLARAVVGDGFFSQDEVIKAINAELTALKKEQKENE